MATTTMRNDNAVAPQGYVYVCAVCGKRSRDVLGGRAVDPDWDSSCSDAAVLVADTQALRRDRLYLEALRLRAFRDKLVGSP